MSALQKLYEELDIETVHAIGGANSMEIETECVDGVKRSMALPEGHYLIVKVVAQPTPRPGLFAVQAPKPEHGG
jgi:hypothetical protein